MVSYSAIVDFLAGSARDHLELVGNKSVILDIAPVQNVSANCETVSQIPAFIWTCQTQRR
jgi:hypothetical protein